MKLELEGKITKGRDFDEIEVGGESVAEFAESFSGEIATLKYYTSDTPINKETVVEDFLRSFYEGKTEADGTYVCGSSWTGVYAKHDTFEIGGHDIIEELGQNIGKYCYLIVTTAD